MTTKRKAIMKAIALAGSITMDDLCLSTGMARKNAGDNIKATVRDELIERIRDDVTGQPAYKLTPKGRQWLENDKDDSCSTAQPAVASNTGSKDTGSGVAGGSVMTGPLLVGNAVSAPPKPDKKPAAACADVKAVPTALDKDACLTMASKTIIDFCEWLADKAKVRCPMNLHECKAVVTEMVQIDAGVAAALWAEAKEIGALKATVSELENDIEGLKEVIADQSLIIAQAESNAELPLATIDAYPRYVTAENYIISTSAQEANKLALEIAANIEIDTPVLVFEYRKARELRINWRDA